MAVASSVETLASGGEEAGFLTQASIAGLEETQTVWRQLEATGNSTPSHRFEWIEAWQRHIGSRSGIEPAVVVGYDGRRSPLMVWPFGIRRVAGLRIASWLGGRFANYQMGLYAPGAARRLELRDITLALGALRDERRVDALHLINQPIEWQGEPNPFLQLPHQPAPSQAYSLAIEGRPFDELYGELRSGASRKKLRRAERKLMEDFGGCSVRQPATRLEVDAILDVFFQQKRQRMAESGIPNIFDAPGVQEFLRELGHRSLGAKEPLLDIYWLQAGDRVGGTWAGVRDARRLSGMINSFDMGDLAAFHPGDLLLRHVVEQACKRGTESFDLGTGDAAYKLSWCPRTDHLFESHLALSVMGLGYSAASSSFSRIKRRIKRSPRAMKALHAIGLG